MDNTNANNQVNNNRKGNDFRNIALAIVGVFAIIAAVAGGTFAYFAFSASNNDAVSGTSATANLTLTVKKVSPTSSTGPLVPQLEAGLKSAMSASCVDTNSNVVCQVYEITVKNSSTATVSIAGSLAFQMGSSSKFTNLKWATVSANPTGTTSVTLGTTNTASTTASSIDSTSLTLTAGNSKTYYVVVWINETNGDQNSTDYGTFTGVVEFKDSNGKGLTSTFTS